ncbi:hypothetical protein [Bowdeniella nasicola]|uniref:hypothetical protein n=1 Tax=Bowdeniella nasicola TaxID=208480 RepID=UPI001300CC1D|nr:hypothetical protein [Bowdeniella nasicola]
MPAGAAGPAPDLARRLRRGINAYLAEVSDGEFTAKDFRTWQGTVVAAQALGRAAATGDSSPQAVTAAIKQIAEWLHNTPAIARDSYINPRVIELFEKGTVITGKATDAKVRALLT